MSFLHRPFSLRTAATAAAALGLAALACSAFAGGPPQSRANPLEAERWKTRPVIVVVPQEGDPLLARLRGALDETATREAFRERDMALYTVVAGQGARNGVPLAAGETRALLQALALDARGPAAFVLVGKDGGVKLREGAGVDLQAVFDEIDRMPMRRSQRQD